MRLFVLLLLIATRNIMSALSDIAAKLDADVTTKLAELAALKAQVSDLTTQLAAANAAVAAAQAELADVPAAVVSLTSTDARLIA